MEKLKKLLILVFLGLLLVLALFGIGVGGAGTVLPVNRERHTDNGVKIEWVGGKKEETAEDEQDKN